MAFPSLYDDGLTVVLDLHGATVEVAEALSVRAVREAARRGRTSLKLIHGSSTSDRLHRNRTIKHGLYDLLDSGKLDAYVTDTWRADDFLLLSLSASPNPRPARLRLSDLTS